MEYAYTSFATPAPQRAAEFMAHYFGATQLKPSEFITRHGGENNNVTATGVRFTTNANASHDVYFVDDTDGAAALLRYFHETHRFDLQEHWDWFMDWHLCFNVDDMDLASHRLVADGVPIVTRSSSFYVEVPDGITVQFLSSGAGGEYVWTEAFNFCRTTGAASLASAPQDMALMPPPDPLPPMPEVRPGHHSFFSTTPTLGRDALLALGADLYNTSGVFASTHRYGDGTCALLEWLQLPDFQIHFVDQFRKYEGAGRSVADVEALLEAAHGDMAAYDAFMNNRVGFRVADVAAYRAALAAAALPYLDRGPGAVLVELPGGIILELFEGG